MSPSSVSTNCGVILVDNSDIDAVRRFGPGFDDALLLRHGDVLDGRHDEALLDARLVALGPGEEQLLSLGHLSELAAGSDRSDRGRFVVALDMSTTGSTDGRRFAETLAKVPDAQVIGVRLVGSAASLLLSFGDAGDELPEGVSLPSVSASKAELDAAAVSSFRAAAETRRRSEAQPAAAEVQKQLAKAELRSRRLNQRLENKQTRLRAQRQKIQRLRGRVRELDARLSRFEGSAYVRAAIRVEELENAAVRRLRVRRRTVVALGGIGALLAVALPVATAWLTMGSVAAGLVAMLLVASLVVISAGMSAVVFKHTAEMRRIGSVAAKHQRQQARRLVQLRSDGARRDKRQTQSLAALRKELSEGVRTITSTGQSSLETVAETLGEVSAELSGLSAGLQPLSAATPELRQLQESALQRLDEASAADADLAKSLQRLGQVQERLHRHGRQQIEATVNLFQVLSPEAGIPRMGGWAASPDVLRFLVNELLENRPATVLECGSGASTVLLAMAARRYGLSTRVVALEHDEHFAEQTRNSLELHGLTDVAEVRLAPLTEVSNLDHRTPWYDTAALQGVSEVGLMFVDGPPADTGTLSRWPAVPLTRERLSERCTIVLDDLVRAEEKDVAKRWRDLLGGFSYEEVDFEKGAAVFRRRPESAGLS